MKELLLMCGIPGSGKSTVAKGLLKQAEFTDETITYISRDDIRFEMLKGTEDYEAAFSNRDTATTEEEIEYIQRHYFSKEDEVYAKFIEKIKEGLASSDLTIADATHLSAGARSKLLRALGKSLKGIEVNILVMDIPLMDALAQNENRKGTITYVPPKTIINMYKSFTKPEFDEGFTNIYYWSKEKFNE